MKPKELTTIFSDFKLKKPSGLLVYIKIFQRFMINPYSAGIDFSRQNMTSVDVIFWRLKSIPAL